MGWDKPESPGIEGVSGELPPDFQSLWKQYAGEMDNINRQNEGELAAVRARLSAAGATPDILMMQTEHLESQRKSKVAKLQAAPGFQKMLEEFQKKGKGKSLEEFFAGMPSKPVKPNTVWNTSRRG
jgi:hypothetical protein